MARPVLVSFVWPKNAHVLGMLMQNHGFDVAYPENALPESLAALAAAAGARLIPFSARLSPQNVSESEKRAAEAMKVLPDVVRSAGGLDGLDRDGITKTIESKLSNRLRDSMAFVDALEALRAKESIAGLLVNETDLAASKTATLWARENGIPSFLLSHGSNIGAAYTVTNKMLADYLFVFGERGTEVYLDMGIAREQMVVTGNPAWDDYARLLQSRDQYRAEVYRRLDLIPNAPLVVFATTWNAKLTALHDKDIFEKTVRGFLGACKRLQDAGFVFNAIVKDRPSNAQFGREEVQRIADEVGAGRVSYADGDMPVFLCAADAIVSYDSNVFVEAMIAGVPSIGIWAPSSWLLGPALDRRDGIPLVQYDNVEGLADVIRTLLGDQTARAAVLHEQAQRLPYFHMALDGKAGERTAAAIALRINPSGKSASNGATPVRYAWHELSDPRTVAEKGGTQEYYDHARPELIGLLSHTPRVVLDIGCAGGATGKILKEMHPSAVVTGIELSEEAAALAATRLDRVLRENVETLDFEGVGFAHGSIDTVFFPDVLEHLYDPWKLVARIKPFLSPDAQVLASIPNVRNLWLINELISGKWQYTEEGLLDVTHIRFFTLQSVIDLFAQTGYSITRLGQNVDGRVPEIACPPDGTVNVEMPTGAIKTLSARDVWELRTLQFLVDAKPVFA